MQKTKPIFTIHGVSTGGLQENTGYSRKPAQALAVHAQGLGAFDFRFTEGLWADLAERFAGQLSPVELKELGLLGDLADYAIDVVTYQGTCRDKILRRLRDRMERTGPGTVVLAHSLGTVITMDIVIQYLREGLIHPDRPRSTWPISSILTLGSPLGIDVPYASGIGFMDRARTLEGLAFLAGRSDCFEGFWVNLHDKDDPVTTGSLLGSHSAAVRLADFEGYARLGVYDREVNVGFHLLGHTQYWGSPIVAQYLFDMVTL